MIVDPAVYEINPFLTDFSVGFADQTLVGDSLFPVTEVSVRTGRYRVFDRSNWLIYPDTRAPGGVANEVGGYKWSEDSFTTAEHALKAAVVDEEVEEQNNAQQSSNLQVGLDSDIEAVEQITRSIELGREKSISTLAGNTATYPAGSSVTLLTADQWDNYAGATSDPVAALKKGARTIQRKILKPPNVLAMPMEAQDWIENHPKVIDRFKNFSLSAPDAFRTLTGFNGRIVYTESVYNNANSVYATENITRLWGFDAILAYVDPRPGQRVKTFAKTFVRPYGGQRRIVDGWYDKDRKATIHRVMQRYDVKVVSPEAGYILKNVITGTA